MPVLNGCMWKARERLNEIDFLKGKTAFFPKESNQWTFFAREFTAFEKEQVLLEL